MLLFPEIGLPFGRFHPVEEVVLIRGIPSFMYRHVTTTDEDLSNIHLTMLAAAHISALPSGPASQNTAEAEEQQHSIYCNTNTREG
jgi:hypothetical protein